MVTFSASKSVKSSLPLSDDAALITELNCKISLKTRITFVDLIYIGLNDTKYEWQNYCPIF
jgi:hypothetical protein